MKLLIYGDHTSEAEELAKVNGFDLVNTDPEFVVSCGGDGTLMKSEHDFPGLPKIILRSSRICKKCHQLTNSEVLQKVKSGEYKIEEYFKVIARVGNKEVIGLNEIIVHNKDPRQAIRYEIFINNVRVGGEIIGDGVVVSTPFGSTGYYRSITDSFFEVGIGVAFNNSTEQSDHMVLREDTEIKIKIMRGPAFVYADNQDESIEVKTGEEIIVKKSRHSAKIIKVKHE